MKSTGSVVVHQKKPSFQNFSEHDLSNDDEKVLATDERRKLYCFSFVVN